tara:strand:+ start:482 stop:631 length:150 start_codon:yes stop_codon:yes gene_type:complete
MARLINIEAVIISEYSKKDTIKGSIINNGIESRCTNTPPYKKNPILLAT